MPITSKFIQTIHLYMKSSTAEPEGPSAGQKPCPGSETHKIAPPQDLQARDAQSWTGLS